MLISKKLFIFLFNISELFIISVTFYILLYPLYIATEVIFPYSFTPIDLCQNSTNLWSFLKQVYIFFFIFSNIIINNFILNRFIFKFFFKNPILYKANSNAQNILSYSNEFKLLIGKSKTKDIYIPESGLYQNFLITGTIGSR